MWTMPVKDSKGVVKYVVKMTVTTGTKNRIRVINTAYDTGSVAARDKYVSWIDDIGADTGQFNLYDFRGDSPWGWTAAHESGHLMGLPDLYSRNNPDVPYPGKQNNLMGAVNKNLIEPGEIWNIIQYSKKRGGFTQK